VLAAGGAFGSAGTRLLSAMGLGNAATSGQRVQGTATDAGLTVRVTAAYRDHYLAVVTARVDGADNAHVSFWGRDDTPPPLAATSSGDLLTLWGAGASSDGTTMVLARRDFSALNGTDLTLTFHGIGRCQTRSGLVAPGPNVPPQLRPGSSAPAGAATTVCSVTTGTWVVRLRVPIQGSLARDVSAPEGGQLDGVRVTFHDVASNGSYLSVKEDTTEVTPGALARALTTVPADLRPQSDPLWLSVYDSGGRQAGTLLQGNDVPSGKGNPPGPLSGTFHWTYFFTIPGPGTYRLVVHGVGEDQLVRTIQVP
jgi:hypothetical protein